MSVAVKSLSELYEASLQFFGMPYIWGGDGDIGFDCSGLVQRIMMMADLDPPGDQTAHSLYLHFKKNGIPNTFTRGSIAFFGVAERISHVGWMIDEYCMLNASGGGQWCKNKQDAKRSNASVKIQPVRIFQAPPLVDAFFPYYVDKGIRLR